MSLSKHLRTRLYVCASPTGLVDSDLSYAVDHLKKPPVFSLLPLTPNKGRSNYNSNLLNVLPQHQSCVCVCPDMDEEKETLFGVPGQIVGSSQPSCHAVQGAVRYDWLRVSAAKLPPCSSSVHLLPQTYLSVCFYLCLLLFC